MTRHKFAIVAMAASACSNQAPTPQQQEFNQDIEANQTSLQTANPKEIAYNLDLIRKQGVFDFEKVSKSQENWEMYVADHCAAVARNGNGMVSVEDCRARKAQERALELASFVID